ncbi:hypothetical protein AAFC00_007289 [Neodothiora populina]|uniref:Zn(2)-C6 fungal-type domain-containing protein n=1 Tax=Neodothiora populina TaxID=2781224 RepID=A0ABR3PHT5_9PEZI
MAWPSGSNFSPSLQHSNLQPQPATTQSPVIGAADFSSSLPATSPTQHTPGGSVPGLPAVQGRKRKQSESNGPSPDGGDVQSSTQQASKTHPVKRACNQCRQQKLKCNIVTDPEFQACSRCVKHNLICAIDPGFRRQEKRQRHAEMERELSELRAELAELRGRHGGMAPAVTMSASMSTIPAQSQYPAAAPSAQFPGPNEAAASRSLLDLAHGGFEGSPVALSRQPTLHTLGRVTLTEEEISELMNTYFERYHPFLPLLPPDFPRMAFFNLHPLLHWAVITVASRHYAALPTLLQELKEPLTEFLWYTISKVPQTYHVVKALCLICAWPLPTNSTSADPSMMICGSMIQLAMQFGLHRPAHAQDFSRFKIELREEDIRDRMNTWVVCNLVAQNISTGYGMPQISRWNWFTHGLHLDRISPALVIRCKIERFIEKITRALYTMQRDEVGPVDEPSRALTIDTFGRECDELRTTVQAAGATPIDMLHCHIATLHLRLTALFDNPKAANYVEDLRKLHLAASTLLLYFLKLPTPQTTEHSVDGSIFATNYVMQMVLAAGFTLLKLLNSFFATHVDVPAGRTLFLSTVTALRSISVERNDLPQRLAEVLAQLWQSSPQGQNTHRLFDSGGVKKEIDSSLQLKVRCRMSMSLLYDSVWRWKDQMGASAVKNLDRAVINPTIPGTGATSSSRSSVPPNTSHPHDAATGGDVGGGVGGLHTDGTDLGMPALVSDWPNEMSFGSTLPFDSLGWALDSFLDMNGINNEGFMGM